MGRRDASPARSRRKELASILDLEEEQLRGVRMTRLLARMARLFARGGAAAHEDPRGTFAQSEAVSRVEYFVSHAWVSPRIGKYFALCRHLNGTSAIALVLVLDLVLLLWALHRDPVPGEATLTRSSLVDKTDHVYPLITFLVLHGIFVAYLLTLAFGHTLSGRGRAAAFLDIACVPQEDADKKATGIARLGAVLARSERMVLLVDEHYWTRLWCIFEIAAFCRHAERGRLIILPLHTAFRELGFMCTVQLLCGLQLYIGGGWARSEFAAHAFSLAATMLVCLPITMIAIVKGRRSQEALRALRTFSIADARCHSPEDREALTEVICAWYADPLAGEDDPARLREIGRHKFEMFVRHDLAPSIEGQEADGWVQLLACSVCALLPFMMLSISAPTVTLPHAAVTLLVVACYFLVSFPLLAYSTELGASLVVSLLDRVRHLTSPRTLSRALLTCAAYVVGTLASVCIIPLLMSLRTALTTPNLVHAPAWAFADDGLDADTRRFAKHWMLAACALFALALWQARR